MTGLDIYRATDAGWARLSDGSIITPPGGGGGGGGGGSVQLKPRFAGLDVTDPSKLSQSQYLGVVKGALVKSLNWNALNPSSGTYAWGALDKILDALPSGCYVKIVADGGNYAPDWVKAHTGTVRVYLSRGQSYGDCAHFWDPWYVTQYQTFMDAFAARYDPDQRVRAVVQSGVMTENSEPFTLGGDAPSISDLYNAGLNYTNHKQSLNDCLTHMLQVWKTTRVELALHSAWQTAVQGGMQSRPWSDIQAFVDPFVQSYGTHLITADYGLGPSDGPPSQPYAYMQARGADSGYQLTVGTPYNQDTRATSVVNAINMGGAFCEHAQFTDGTDLDTGTLWTLQEQENALLTNAGLLA